VLATAFLAPVVPGWNTLAMLGIQLRRALPKQAHLASIA
jgi:hypothetical protein